MSIQDSLALKYRPKKLSEVIGQPHIVRSFYNAFEYKTLHHAYILAGKFGCGKSSCGRIIAAMENCKEGKKDPCGKCSICQEIFLGKSSDVIEIDAASAGKIDNIRALHKSLWQNPIECRTKYVILDESQGLTAGAAEASLKMIEEPPDHVRFLLLTTEPQSFKPTIHSRCIMWTFNEVSWQEMADHLEKIALSEKIKCHKESLILIAKHSKGSVRNSIQNLQTLLNYAGKNEFTSNDVAEALRIINNSIYFDLMESILDKNISKSFVIINNLFKDGKEAKLVLDGLYEYLNNLIVSRVCSDTTIFNFSDEELKRYQHLNSRISTGNIILRMTESLSKIAFDIEYSINPIYSFNRFIVEIFSFMKKTEKK